VILDPQRYFITDVIFYCDICYIITWKDNSKNQATLCGELVDPIYCIGIKKRFVNILFLVLWPKNNRNHVVAISQEPDHQFSKKLNGIASNNVSFMTASSLKF
jgi:hypothetical protein